ncbi:MAG: DNA methyltransferase [Gammaproteobacteria bacterium]
MPEGLAEFFIQACAPVGGVVIDPFAGSGTTIVVARRLGTDEQRHVEVDFQPHRRGAHPCGRSAPRRRWRSR